MLGSTRCPRCAKHLPAGADFCRRCGRDLRAPHGLSGAEAYGAPSVSRRVVPPPPVPARQRGGGGRFAIVAFALFALLFIVGLLFSTRTAGPPVTAPRSAPPAGTNVEGQSEWGDEAHSTDSQHDSRKHGW